MIRIETGILPEKEILYELLLNCEYMRFIGWPGANPESVANFLYDDICQLGSNDDLITAYYNGKLAALLSYSGLDWDTKHYGYKSGHINHLLTDNKLDQTVIRDCLEKVLSLFKQHCSDAKIRHVSADLSSWDFNKSYILQAANFKYILTQIDGFVKGYIDPIKAIDEIEFGLVRPDEIDFYEKLAANSYFLGGRFYADSGFDRIKVDQMYSSLVSSSFKSGNVLLSYRVKDQPVGLFISKQIKTYSQFAGLRVALLRFLIVDPQFRGRRFAQDLFIRTVNYLKENCDLVGTGLEIHNIPSLNLHSKLTFSFNYTHNAYHWWG
jgi:hypothetical protein